jgi:hypothetical protein
VGDLPYEASVKQPYDFFTDEVLSLNRLLPGPLMDRSGIGVDHQMVLNHLPRHPRHLRRLLGKHVYISPKEGEERKFLFAVQITRDTCSLSSLSPNLDGLHGDVSEGCMRGAKAELHWRELDGVGPLPQAPRQLCKLLLGPGASPAQNPPRHSPPGS